MLFFLFNLFHFFNVKETFRPLSEEECEFMDDIIGFTVRNLQPIYNPSRLALPDEIRIAARSDGYFEETKKMSDGRTVISKWRPDGVWRKNQRVSVVSGGLEFEVRHEDRPLTIRYEKLWENGGDNIIIKENNVVVGLFRHSKEPFKSTSMSQWTLFIFAISVLMFTLVVSSLVCVKHFQDMMVLIYLSM